jgi:mxaJ protein
MCSSFLRGAVGAAAVALAIPVDARELKVCADPNNLPFSDKYSAGFENRIVELIAAELGARVTYTWHAQRRGFLRNTLQAGLCDVVAGIPVPTRSLRTTKPYYRSSYAFVRRAAARQISSFDDPALRDLIIGVQLVGDEGLNTPPIHDLAKRGIISNVRGYLVYGNYAMASPLSPIIKAVATREVDVAIVWGPIAGYFAARQTTPLAITPILFDPTDLTMQMTYDIAMGVRKADTALASELNRALDHRRGDIDAILKNYDVPRTDLSSTLAGGLP